MAWHGGKQEDERAGSVVVMMFRASSAQLADRWSRHFERFLPDPERARMRELREDASQFDSDGNRCGCV